MTIYDFKAVSIGGIDTPLSNFAGKVLLIVNVASACGYTPQYEGLETLYEKYHDRGFEILGFPCNQFGGQEPGQEAEIQEFCSRNYGVTFPLFSKIEVNGGGAHPLYRFLKQEQPGIFGIGAIKWNFTKFLIDRQGKPVGRYAPQDKPESLVGEIEKLL